MGLFTQRERISRRQFAAGISMAAAVLGSAWRSAGPAEERGPGRGMRIPLKIGHRAASMQMVGNLEVFKLASRIPGLMGVELQVASGRPNLRDMDFARQNKKEATRWGVMIPSLAGVWDRGVSILSSPEAKPNLLQSIRVAELLGAGVILVAFFKENAPDMSLESSYGPVVELLQAVAPQGADAGVVLGLENSLSPAGNRKLIDLVGHPNVRVYYDLHNMAHYGHQQEAIPGIRLLGRERICQVHVKNGTQLIEEPGPIDWKAAFEELNGIEYDGWYVFESQHSDRAQMIDATTKNIEFLRRRCRMPLG